MQDFFEDLYDDDNQDNDSEPSFSLYDFKKWLSKQKKPKGYDKLSESVEQSKKDELKNKFKEQFKERINDRIEKRSRKH